MSPPLPAHPGNIHGHGGVTRQKSPPEAHEAAQRFGAPLATHRSRPISAEILATAEWIFCMERQHTEHIHLYYPRVHERTVLLRGFGRTSLRREIQDPYGKSPRVYRRVFSSIAREIDRTIPRLFHAHDSCV
ncbi:hypothetical protein CALK_1746 [Chitinivibrio alkaliphilus ACht1]|uniref:Phosphotyrosine protein phosphatase I domain-containing protein n=1 Tax=Chitinivibrio alkaliphilus ACht1 TaxID=1313304 RepID=U7D757_9BACT|nr:hypothetical protein [Chitinivibrio alkaliphilus]ERP31396.1 hypothetical protein CALK_1746 [Chitinivibrio alkaliphilus ACht1]